jgi:hypothetical protein
MKELKKYFSAGLLALGLVSLAQAQNSRGDINSNGYPFEIADAVLFINFLAGTETLSPQSLQQSDINFDDRPGSIADLTYFFRIVEGSVAPVTGLVYPVLYRKYDLLSGQFQTANPGDTVFYPIYLRNQEAAGGLSFNLKFDAGRLSLLAMDTVSSRLSFWNQAGDLSFVQGNDRLFMYAFCQHCISNDLYSKVLAAGAGIILNLRFEVSNSAPLNTLLPIEFVTEENLGHYNTYGNIQDPSRLIIPSVFSAGIYTGVPEAGDVFIDGKKNIIDIVYLVNHIFKGFLPPNPYSLGDLNSDSQITLVDVMMLVNQIY